MGAMDRHQPYGMACRWPLPARHSVAERDIRGHNPLIQVDIGSQNLLSIRRQGGVDPPCQGG